MALEFAKAQRATSTNGVVGKPGRTAPATANPVAMHPITTRTARLTTTSTCPKLYLRARLDVVPGGVKSIR